MEEIRGIASHDDFVFHATSYGDVQKITDEITKMMCATGKFEAFHYWLNHTLCACMEYKIECVSIDAD